MRRCVSALLGLGLLAGPAHAADPVLVAAGDMACDPGSASYNVGNGTMGTPGSCHQRYTSDLNAGLAPTDVLALGDMQYDDGVLSKFQQSYAPSWGRAAIKAKTKPILGNHEYGAGNTTNGNVVLDANATGYFTYFSDQLSGFPPAARDPMKGWYSFDVPVTPAFSWHVVALNSECAAGQAVGVGVEHACEAGSEQEQWLRSDLAANKSDCTVAYWHHPLFSSAGSGGSAQVKPLWDALYDDYADIVLAGHRHSYERFAQQDSAGVARPGRGIRSWVSAAGGKDLFAVNPPQPNSEQLDNTTFGVLELTLHGPSAAHPRGWYEWQFVRDGLSGTFTDSGSADCVGPPRPAVVTSSAKPPPQAVPDRVAPKLSKPRLSRKRFRVGRGATARSANVPRGTVIGYTLSEPATASLMIERRKLVRKGGKRVRRYRRAGTLKRKGKPGRRRVKFSGRIGRRALKPGSYRLTIATRDLAGNLGKPRRLYFTVVK